MYCYLKLPFLALKFVRVWYQPSTYSTVQYSTCKIDIYEGYVGFHFEITREALILRRIILNRKERLKVMVFALKRDFLGHFKQATCFMNA